MDCYLNSSDRKWLPLNEYQNKNLWMDLQGKGRGKYLNTHFLCDIDHKLKMVEDNRQVRLKNRWVGKWRANGVVWNDLLPVIKCNFFRWNFLVPFPPKYYLLLKISFVFVLNRYQFGNLPGVRHSSSDKHFFPLSPLNNYVL